jgi:hypothetical protein
LASRIGAMQAGPSLKRTSGNETRGTGTRTIVEERVP